MILAGLGVAFYPLLPALSASDPDLLAGLDTDLLLRYAFGRFGYVACAIAAWAGGLFVRAEENVIC